MTVLTGLSMTAINSLVMENEVPVRPRKPGVIEAGGIVIDNEAHRVTVDGKSVSLSPMEYRLLEFFVAHPDKVFSRSQLCDLAWKRGETIGERAVDVRVRRLRKVLGESGRGVMIQTVQGVGYRFSERI
ncbi:winged helix-turn-helix domain-containing protein [Methylomagnum sp.]